MKEYDCKDIIKAVNEQRKSLKDVAVIRLLSIISSSKDNITNTAFKDNIITMANTIDRYNKHLIEGAELPEIVYNPIIIEEKEQKTSNSRSSKKNKTTTNANSDKEFSKNKEIFNANLNKVQDYVTISFNEFVKMAETFLNDNINTKNNLSKTVASEKTLTRDVRELMQKRIITAKHNILLISLVLENVKLKMSSDNTAINTVLNNINEIYNTSDKKSGQELASKFSELIIYSAILAILTKKENYDVMLQELSVKEVKIRMYAKYAKHSSINNTVDTLLTNIKNNLELLSKPSPAP